MIVVASCRKEIFSVKKSIRFTGIFLCLLIAVTVFFQTSASAANGPIDTSNASDGYFTVSYSATTSRMKVGVTFNGSTRYIDYKAGTTASYAFEEGNGAYTLTLYVNVGGNSYKRVASSDVNVTFKKDNAQYLASTVEINFDAGGTVIQKANELCKNTDNDESRIVAIYKYMLSFSYDFDLAGQISRGEVSGYKPNTAAVLKSGKGICYDLSALFAAMCRSQGVPCKLVKGTYNNGAHAWNEVFCGGTWHRIDMTYAVQFKPAASTIAECETTLTGYTAG